MAFSERALAAASLLLRVLTLFLLIASLVIIVTNKKYEPFTDVVDPPNLTFRDFYAYRYVCSVGCYYWMCIYFVGASICRSTCCPREENWARSWHIALLIFTDVVLAVLISTGAEAGLGLTVEFQRYPQDADFKSFLNFVDISCGLMLGATICMVIMLMASVHSLT
ncbi:unnamed protein product [Urochloa decumbens]|uniref:CASP-like protein n=1 Tax=Urochloa decumbens TaxID=240449 RepID=A0ABC9CF30_9POAL